VERNVFPFWASEYHSAGYIPHCRQCDKPRLPEF
jgi:hypothetical protein